MDLQHVAYGVGWAVIMWVFLYLVRRFLPSRFNMSSSYGILRGIGYAAIFAVLGMITAAISFLVTYFVIYGLYNRVSRPAKT